MALQTASRSLLLTTVEFLDMGQYLAVTARDLTPSTAVQQAQPMSSQLAQMLRVVMSRTTDREADDWWYDADRVIDAVFVTVESRRKVM